MSYEETRSDFLGAITDLLVQACYERDHQRKYRDVHRKENELSDGVRQGTEQRKYPPLSPLHDPVVHIIHGKNTYEMDFAPAGHLSEFHECRAMKMAYGMR